jgi:(1->4)-alpha-D-glucan 1-alpha-D-glucosylmutase
VAAVPRLLTGLLPDAGIPPLGEEIWKDTWVAMPPDGDRYRNVFTQETVTPTSFGAHRIVPAGQLFADCPVALLERLS